MKTLPLLLILSLIGCSKELLTNTGTFNDSRDKHEYKWVQISTQTWMAENLAYLPLVSVGQFTTEWETIPKYFVYDYQGTSVSAAMASSNYRIYGVLYNWAAAKVACPNGWHLPTNEEWNIMEIFLGMDPIYADSLSLRSSGDVAKKLKTKTGWAKNGGGDNSSGFSALPAGGRWYNGGDFLSLGSVAEFWSASEYGDWYAMARYLHYQYDGMFWAGDFRSNGNSVRCLKDN
ncbi:MAG: FISUMP domain-containing protein [Bacteroidales bacterium]|jgi:uncharacterized protein (TIGR02145 family)